MRLHEFNEEFQDLITIVAENKRLPESAVERDYYIVMLLQNLANSEYSDQCVFKGGTSLSKCYPGSIERFSEDIDLTFLGMDLDDKKCDRAIKRIETVMTAGADTEKIGAERSNRAKSMLVWFGDKANAIKLEIGSSIRPDPYSKKTVKTYIHEYLEENSESDDIEKYELEPVTINVLNIERTFVDKLMSVKRHAISGSLNKKVRHVYDVTRLYALPQIKAFFDDEKELKRLIRITKETDRFYLDKRRIQTKYTPDEPYAFQDWQDLLTDEIKTIYESLHKSLLYTDEQQDFEQARQVFAQISDRLAELGE